MCVLMRLLIALIVSMIIPAVVHSQVCSRKDISRDSSSQYQCATASNARAFCPTNPPGYVMSYVRVQAGGTGCPGWTTGSGFVVYACFYSTCSDPQCAVGYSKYGSCASSPGNLLTTPDASGSQSDHQITGCWEPTCIPCTNLVANATYTGTGSSATSCPWSCNSGYGLYGGACVVMCNAGYYLYDGSCIICNVGAYSMGGSSTGCLGCTNGPPRSNYTGPGTTATNCPWVCGAGSARDVSNQCPSCVPGEYI
jgi:hypothetical protein